MSFHRTLLGIGIRIDLRLEMQHTLDQKQEEHARETSRRKAQEELAYQQLEDSIRLRKVNPPKESRFIKGVLRA